MKFDKTGLIGEHADTVISTRIRLARNLKGYPFPRFMDKAQRSKVTQQVKDAAESISGLALSFVELASLPQRERLALVERHSISREFAAQEDAAFLISEDATVSIMINEEDHLRIQVLKPGMDLMAAYELADLVDTALDERLHFAFDERLGYLTQCPTNLGTGMRASLMLHLPAMQERGLLQSLNGAISKLGLIIRGAYGEGTRPFGAMYQMSNQITLGISEQAAIENLSGIAEQIMDREKAVRKELCADEAYEDRIWRSYGVLKSARLISCEEAMNCLSDVRLGVFEDLITNTNAQTVTNLMQDIQPGCLMSACNDDLNEILRDRHRSALLRSKLGEIG